MLKFLDGKALKNIIETSSRYFTNKKDEVDKLNVFPVPDGDTGSNMAYTLNYAAKEVGKASDKISDILNSLSKGALMGAKGNSGVILSQIFRGFSKSLINKEKIYTKDFAKALQSGSETAYKAVMKPVEGTILTVARESSEVAVKISESISDFENFLIKVIEAAEQSLLKTPELLPVLKEAGVVDSGGMGYLYILKGMLKAIQGKIVESKALFEETGAVIHNLKDIKYNYCTEILIKAKKYAVDILKDKFSKYGDSLVVVADDDLIKVHVHTNNPGLVLEEGLKIGELIKIKIDNMKIQHESIIEQTVPQKKYGILAVTNGEGIKNIFMDLGCDVVIEGGQTMNPSTNDIIEGINKINAENIIVFPNNKNVILACEQAKKLSEKNIYVIPTRSFDEAISAIINIDITQPVDELINNINETIKSVKTIEITYSIRDTKIDDKEIKKGDILGFVDEKFEESGKDYNEVAKKLIENVIDKNSSIITIYYGKDVEKSKALQLKNELNFDGDIEIQAGGQPLYYYVISVE